MSEPLASSSLADRLRLNDRWELLLDAIGVFVVLSYAWPHLGAGTVPAGFALVLAAWLAGMSRRRWPVVAIVLTIALCVPTMFLGQPYALYVWSFAQLCLFSFALHRGIRGTAIAGSVLAIILYVGSATWLGIAALEPTSLGLIAWTAAAAGLGTAVRLQREYVKSLAERAELISANHEREVEQRVTLERLRIAADLHDVLAHHIAVISVHAGSAEAQLPAESARAADSLRAIRVAVGGALVELQSIVGFLREPASDATSADRSPTPGSDRVPELVESFRRIGVSVTIDWPDSSLTGRLTPAGDLASYRVLQEALTNAHKHGAGTVSIQAIEQTNHFVITVKNPVRAPVSSSPRTGGFGLVGMRERITSAGGSLEIAQNQHEFALSVTLPLIAVQPEQEAR